MKNKLFIFSITFLILSCGYKSEWEAMRACEKWAEKQDLIYVINRTIEEYDMGLFDLNDLSEEDVMGLPTTKCMKDGDSTRIILGLKLKRDDFGTKDSPVIWSQLWRLPDDLNSKVIKRFRY